MNGHIYLDYNATTPHSQSVIDALQRGAVTLWGNPGSSGPFAEAARKAIEECQVEVSALLGCDSKDVVITSGGTEANNTVLYGVLDGVEERRPRRRCILSAFEHPAVDKAVSNIVGVEVVRIEVDHTTGRINEQRFVEELKLSSSSTTTTLVSIMWANNETGCVQDIARLAHLTRLHCPHAIFHTDAAQALGKVPVAVTEEIDAITLVGHKMGAPKSIGALYWNTRRCGPLRPLLIGGGQQSGRRSGTESALLCAALTAACKEVRLTFAERTHRMRQSRDALWLRLKQLIPECRRWTPEEEEKEEKEEKRSFSSLPNTLSVGLSGDCGDPYASSLVEALSGRGVLCSAGAACHRGSVRVSETLRAMGVEEQWAVRTLRLSTGPDTTEDQVNQAAQIIHDVWIEMKQRKKNA